MQFRRARYTRTQNAWAFYDWANSVYSLVIATAIFPIYFESVTPEVISLLGVDLSSTSLYSYSLSVSFLIVALMSPLLSGLADHTGNKKGFMKFFCYLGAFSCMALSFFSGSDTLWLAIVASMFASIGFWGSIVFYNAFLPEIATANQHDALSAKGFSWGYIGGALLLIFNLLLIEFPHWFALEGPAQASRVSFATVGVWWLLFAQVTFAYLPGRKGERVSVRGYVWTGYQRLHRVWRMMKKTPHLQWYLLSFFAFSMGVQTVILMASLYGSKQLNLPADKLILTILIIQFVAIGGAYLFAYLSKVFGNIQSLMMAVVVWMLVCVSAYMMNPNHPHVLLQFFALGGVVGMVMGGIQSLARSTYSKMIPETVNTASYFSFFDVTEKIAIVVGTMFFGLTVQIYDGDMGRAALILGLFFLVSFLLLTYLLRVIKPHNTLSELSGSRRL